MHNLAIIDNRIQAKGGKVFITEGFGEGLCLILGRFDNVGVGLGDHIASLPVIYELVKTQKVTVYASPFYKTMYESIGCEFHAGNEIYPGFVEANKSNFAFIYEMIEWSLNHLMETDGKTTKDFNECFAQFFDIDAPRSFDYAKALQVKEDRELKETDYVLFAPFSISEHRQLPRIQETHKHLRKRKLNVQLIGHPDNLIYNLNELINLIYNAKAVIACDSAILHISRALGIPSLGVWGGTKPLHVISQYDYLTGGKKFEFQKKPNKPCNSPCSLLGVNGWGKDFLCLTQAECLIDVSPSELCDSFVNFYNTLEG